MFEKVSFEQYKSTRSTVDEDTVKKEWENIKLPKRATSGSAGYDFFLPFQLRMRDGTKLFIPTGVRCTMPKNIVLLCVPKSGLGSKYRLQFNNTIGVVDSDYYYSDNEGHIGASLINDNGRGETLSLEAGKAFFQGFFVQYFTTENDITNGIRNGGYGSTGV